MSEEMTLKIVETPVAVEATPIVNKEPQLVMELITPDMTDFLFHHIKPMVDEFIKASLNEHIATVDIYNKIKWGSVNLFYAYVVDDLAEYMKSDENISPLENKYRRIFNSKVKKEFAGYALVEFKLNETKPPHIEQSAILPKFQKTNILELGQKYIEEEFKRIGAKEIVASTIRAEMHDKMIQMGYVEAYTIYKKKL